ncbi:MAG: insulinase family protein [Candidatus Heimdallarchaeota archaeon]|nr:insulinase family protein [Candidatus Heimdallarchaeota archaeon]
MGRDYGTGVLIMSEENFEIRKLKNGTPVLLANFADSETVTIGITYNVGGRNEWNRGIEFDGVSHFLEHQFFKGNPEIGLDPLGVNQAFDSLGGMTNAFTMEDTTCYYVKCLNTELDNAIDLWDKLLIFGEIDQKEFDKEAFVVKQEFRRMEDSPTFLLYVKMKKQLHKGTSLEMDVIGNEVSLSKIKLHQMEEYRDEHYGMENAALMVLGNFDKEYVYNKLNDTFGSKAAKLDKPKYELTSYSPPTESKFKLVKVEKQTPLVFFGLGIKTPGALSEDRAALEIIMSYLTLGKSSLLQEKLVRSGMCSFATSFTELYQDIGNIVLLAGTPLEMYPQAHAASMKMLHQLLTMEWSSQLLDTIIERIEYSYRSNSEEPMSMLMGQASSLWRRGKFQSMNERLDELKNVTLDKIYEVRQKILTNLNGVYGVIGSDNSFVPEFPEGTWSGTFE